MQQVQHEKSRGATDLDKRKKAPDHQQAINNQRQATFGTITDVDVEVQIQGQAERPSKITHDETGLEESSFEMKLSQEPEIVYDEIKDENDYLNPYNSTDLSPAPSGSTRVKPERERDAIRNIYTGSSVQESNKSDKYMYMSYTTKAQDKNSLIFQNLTNNQSPYDPGSYTNQKKLQSRGSVSQTNITRQTGKMSRYQRAILASQIKADISEKLSDDELSDYRQLNQESSIEVLQNHKDIKSRNYSYMSKQKNPLRYQSTNVSKSTRLIDRRGHDLSFAADSARVQKKAFQLYMRYYDKAGDTVQMLREQSKYEPLIWPTATIDKRTNHIENIPGKENVNFNAIYFLLKDKDREHQLRDLIAKLHMGEALDMSNRQQIFEDIIIQRIKKLQAHVNSYRSQTKKMLEQTVTADLIQQKLDSLQLPYDDILTQHTQLIDKIVTDQNDSQQQIDQQMSQLSMNFDSRIDQLQTGINQEIDQLATKIMTTVSDTISFREQHTQSVSALQSQITSLQKESANLRSELEHLHSELCEEKDCQASRLEELQTQLECARESQEGMIAVEAVNEKGKKEIEVLRQEMKRQSRAEDERRRQDETKRKEEEKKRLEEDRRRQEELQARKAEMDRMEKAIKEERCKEKECADHKLHELEGKVNEWKMAFQKQFYEFQDELAAQKKMEQKVKQLEKSLQEQIKQNHGQQHLQHDQIKIIQSQVKELANADHGVSLEDVGEMLTMRLDNLKQQIDEDIGRQGMPPDARKRLADFDKRLSLQEQKNDVFEKRHQAQRQQQMQIQQLTQTQEDQEHQLQFNQQTLVQLQKELEQLMIDQNQIDTFEQRLNQLQKLYDSVKNQEKLGIQDINKIVKGQSKDEVSRYERDIKNLTNIVNGQTDQIQKLAQMIEGFDKQEIESLERKVGLQEDQMQKLEQIVEVSNAKELKTISTKISSQGDKISKLEQTMEQLNKKDVKSLTTKVTQQGDQIQKLSQIIEAENEINVKNLTSKLNLQDQQIQKLEKLMESQKDLEIKSLSTKVNQHDEQIQNFGQLIKGQSEANLSHIQQLKKQDETIQNQTKENNKQKELFNTQIKQIQQQNQDLKKQQVELKQSNEVQNKKTEQLTAQTKKLEQSIQDNGQQTIALKKRIEKQESITADVSKKMNEQNQKVGEQSGQISMILERLEDNKQQNQKNQSQKKLVKKMIFDQVLVGEGDGGEYHHTDDMERKAEKEESFMVKSKPKKREPVKRKRTQSPTRREQELKKQEKTDEVQILEQQQIKQQSYLSIVEDRQSASRSVSPSNKSLGSQGRSFEKKSLHQLLYPDQEDRRRRENLRNMKAITPANEKSTIAPDETIIPMANQILIQDQQNKRLRSPSPRYKDYFSIPNQVYTDATHNQKQAKSQHKSAKQTIDSNDKSFGYVSVDIGANLYEQENFNKLLPRNQFMHSPKQRCNIMSGRGVSEDKSMQRHMESPENEGLISQPQQDTGRFTRYFENDFQVDEKSQMMIKEVESEFYSSVQKMAPYLMIENTEQIEESSVKGNIKAAQTQQSPIVPLKYSETLQDAEVSLKLSRIQTSQQTLNQPGNRFSDGMMLNRADRGNNKPSRNTLLSGPSQPATQLALTSSETSNLLAPTQAHHLLHLVELSEDSVPASTALPSALYQPSGLALHGLAPMEPPPLIFEELSMAHIEAEDEEDEDDGNQDDQRNAQRQRRQGPTGLPIPRGQRNERSDMNVVHHGAASKMTFGDDFVTSTEDIHFLQGKTDESNLQNLPQEDYEDDSEYQDHIQYINQKK